MTVATSDGLIAATALARFDSHLQRSGFPRFGCEAFQSVAR
jgi:hypothetical protein